MTRIPALLGIVALSLIVLVATVALARSPEALIPAPSPAAAGEGNAIRLSPPAPDHDRVRAALQGAPLLFIQNVGQFDPQARFQVRGGLGGGALWLAEDALWLTLVKPASPQPSAPTRGAASPLPSPGRGGGGEGVHLRLRFLGANPHPRLEPFRRLETHVSYFIGNDPTKWRADVPVWGGVRYVDLYPGIDLEVVAPTGLRLIVHPGAHLGQVRLMVEGAEGVMVEGERVRLETALGSFSLPPILAGDGAALQPTIANGIIALAPSPSNPFNLFPESVDSLPNRPADDLLYSTFLGGSGDDGGNAIVLDGAGAATVTGYTYSSNFPTTPGAFDPSYNGGWDAFVTRLLADGSGLVYSTFLGGSGDDGGNAIALDGAGAAYVTGYTYSTDFPTTPGAFDPSFNGNRDAFVTRLRTAKYLHLPLVLRGP